MACRGSRAARLRGVDDHPRLAEHSGDGVWTRVVQRARMIADQPGPLSCVDDAGRVPGPAEPGVSRSGCTGGRRSDGVMRKCGGICGAGRPPWREAVFALVRELARVSRFTTYVTCDRRLVSRDIGDSRACPKLGSSCRRSLASRCLSAKQPPPWGVTSARPSMARPLPRPWF